jgi:aspartyl protease family protein
VELGQVTVGGISLSGVDAVVLEGSHPSDALLGMSFLNRLTLENQGNLMLLRKNF